MSARTACTLLVGARRLERLLRSVHQRRAQRHRADRAVPRRGQAARGHRVRPHPAGARHRAADRQPVLRLARLAAREAARAAATSPRCPTGPSVPHMFIVVFLVMLPIYLKTNDPMLAWQAGLAWAFIIGVIMLLGAFVGPTIRKYTPRAAMLGALAGISIAFISMRPGVPELAGAVARVRVARHHPGQLDGARAPAVAAARRTGRGAGRHRARLARHGRPASSEVMDPQRSSPRLRKFGLHLPIPSARFPARACPTSARCSSPPCRSASTTSPRA